MNAVALRVNGRRWMACLARILGLVVASSAMPVMSDPPAPCPSGSQWQGATCLRASASMSRPARFLLTDTGGTGGGFGRGDPHNHLFDVDFCNPQIGWACGFGGVFRTEDGGLTWQRVKPRGGWYHVQMIGPQEIWLLEGFHGQAKAHLWHTTDNGRTWTESLPGQIRGSSDLVCRGPVRWVVCGDYPSWYSNDSGKSWTQISIGGTLKIAVPGDVPSGDGQGYVAYVLGHRGPQPTLRKSADGSRTWSDVPLPGDLPPPRCIFFATSEMGWIGMNDGQVLFTRDGGRTWRPRNLPTNQRAVTMWFDSWGRGFASVENSDHYHPAEAVYETHDGGNTWAAVLGGNKQINGFCALGSGRLWAVGNTPTVLPNDLVAILQQE